MKFTLHLLFLFFIFSFHSYGQDSTTHLKVKWGQVTSLLQKRSNIITNLTKTLSKFKVDKKQNNNLKRLAIDFSNYVSSLRSVDGASILIAVEKDNKLRQSLIVTLIEIDDNQEIKSKQKFADIQANLEGCENSIKNATRNYNDICSKYNRLDLLFLVDYQNKPTEIQF